MAITEVSVLQNNNDWSTFPCELLETLQDPNGRKFMRVKFPNGDIKRIYHDRVRPFTAIKLKEETVMSTETKQYDPWAECPNGEIYERSNEFSSTTICKTVVIIDKANDKYYSINTYNGIAKAGKMEYPIKDLKKLTKKLESKGYTKLSKGSVSASG